MNKKYKSKCLPTFLLRTKILTPQNYRCSIGAKRRPGFAQGAGVLRDIPFFYCFFLQKAVYCLCSNLLAIM